MSKSFDQYQKAAKRTMNHNNTELTKYANLGMGLAGEAGEVCDYLKKVVFHGHDLEQDKVCDELGDVLWYMANLATSVGISLSDVADKNIEKLKKRYPNGFEEEKSKNRQV